MFAAAALLAALVLSGCDRQEETAVVQPRPVRTVTIEKRESGTPITLTGRVEAKDEVNLAFRISGRLLENTVRQGDRVEAGQVVARLEPQNEQNALRSAEAALAAAQAALTQTTQPFRPPGHAAETGLDDPRQPRSGAKAMDTAQAQVDAAQAQLEAARDLVSFTQLEADAPGVVTAVGPRAGAVVQAGQMIATLARKEGRDAVFDVPAQMLRAAPADSEILVTPGAATRTSSRTAASAKCRRRPIRSRGRSRSGSA